MAGTDPTPPGAANLLGVPAGAFADFRAGFGEDLAQALDLATWTAGRDLAEEYRRIEAEVAAAVERETTYQVFLRERVQERLAWLPGAPPGAGLYAVPLAELEQIHKGLLFTGGVEACDGTCHVHDSLPLTIYQIGVSLVSYRGDAYTWGQRLFRRDLRLDTGDLVEEALQLLDQRGRRGGLGQPSGFDQLSELAQRGIMSFAERAVLARHGQALWRIGHGSPAPYELFVHIPDLAIESIKVLRELIEGHQKFVFVASEPTDRALISLGQVLRPLEYAIVGTLRDLMEQYLDQWTCAGSATVDAAWDGVPLTPLEWIRRFRDEVLSQVVYGIYRATPLAPPQVFYAHVDHADLAVRVALADSLLLEQRGFPMLIDLADRVCSSIYGGKSLNELAQEAYAAAGAPFRYQSERPTRIR